MWDNVCGSLIEHVVELQRQGEQHSADSQTGALMTLKTVCGILIEHVESLLQRQGQS